MSLRERWKCLLGHECCYGMPRDIPLKGLSPKDFVSALQFSPLYHGSQKPENCIFQTAMPEGSKGEGKRRGKKKKGGGGNRREGVLNLSSASRSHLWLDPTPNPSDRHLPFHMFLKTLLVFGSE